MQGHREDLCRSHVTVDVHGSGGRGGGVLFVHTYRLLKFIVPYFRLDSILLAEGSVLVPSCEISE
jgi:hypothetical protein